MTRFEGHLAALATRHGKEQLLAPLLQAELGLHVEVVADVDTDRFGTFTRERPREGRALDAARAKAGAALEAHGRADFALASEGSFGPHPSMPFVAVGVELVLLAGRDGHELTGTDLTLETTFAASCVSSPDEARAFATRAQFPSHGLIAMAAPDGQPRPELGLHKGLVAQAEFEAVVEAELRRHGKVWLESDLRAHLNPTRRRSIARAAQALVRAAKSPCPGCARPGWVVVERRAGLPCAECGTPTARARAEVLGCSACGRREERVLDAPLASPSECPACNP